MRRLLSIAAVLCCALPAASSWAFWAPPVTLGSGTLAAAAVTAEAGDGTVGVAWEQGSVSAQDAVVSLHPAGGSWSPPQVISGGGDVSDVVLGADASGGFVLAWIENGYVRAATRAAGGSWTPVSVPLSASGATSLVGATAPDGTTVLAWIEGTELKRSTRAPGGPFSVATTVPAGTSPAWPAIAVGPQSDFLLVWADKSGSLTRVMSIYRGAGAFNFAAPTVTGSGSVGANQTLTYSELTPVFDSNGEMSVVWLAILSDFNADQTTLGWLARWRAAGGAGGNFPAIPQILQTHTIAGTPLIGGIGAVGAGDAGGRTAVVLDDLTGGGTAAWSTRASGTGNAFTTPAAISGTQGALRGSAAGVGKSLIYTERNPAGLSVAAPGLGFGPYDTSVFSLSGTAQEVIAGGDAAGYGWAVVSDKVGSTESLRFFAFDTVAPEARSLSIPATATAGTSVPMSVTPYDALTGASATWDFGDGGSASGASVSHAYDTPGVRTVTVSVKDGAGNVTVATGSVTVGAAPAGGGGGGGGDGGGAGAGGGGGASDTTPPALTAVSVRPHSFRLGSLSARGAAKLHPAIRFVLSEAAIVRATITRLGTKKPVAHLQTSATPGKGHIAITRRIAARAGRYRVRLVAVDASGNTSKAVTAAFRVKR
jgi:hypothetical protein